jgi:hypothetical protein
LLVNASFAFVATSSTFFLPFCKALTGAFVPLRGGDAGLSCNLLALAAVGRIMRERKSPLGAVDEVDARESGRLGAVVAGASEVRDGFAPGAAAFGRVVVDGLRVTFGSSPCFAADAAVGAMRWEGSLTGRVGDFGVGFLKLLDDALEHGQWLENV